MVAHDIMEVETMDVRGQVQPALSAVSIDANRSEHKLALQTIRPSEAKLEHHPVTVVCAALRDDAENRRCRNQ